MRSIPSCNCGAHSRHLVFRWLWYHPGGLLKDCAKEVGLSFTAVRCARWGLAHRTKDLHLRCPECFKPSLRGLVCTNCGVELDMPSMPEGIRFEETSPVHSIQPFNGLGSNVNYSMLRLQYGGRNIKHLVERVDDPLIEGCKSLLWQELKEAMLADDVVEEATRLLVKEIIEFRAKYPGLIHTKGLKEELVRNVIGIVKLRYPNRFRKAVLTYREEPIMSHVERETQPLQACGPSPPNKRSLNHE